MSASGRLGRGLSNEQIALTRSGISVVPRWGDQFGEYTSDSIEATFGVNCLTSARQLRPASLVPPTVVDTIAQWARYSVVTADDDDVLTMAPPPAPVASTEELMAEFGIPEEILPATYEDSRFSNSIYLVRDAAVYELISDVAPRLRLWSDDERGRFRSRHVFPFAELAELGEIDHAVVVVCIPGRLAALGGARGYRSAVHESGRLSQLLELALDGWSWTTEFDDFELCALLDLDGLQRFPVKVGWRGGGAA